MKVLAIDVGTYSIKAQKVSIEKKRVRIISSDEINIAQVRQQLSPNLSDDEVVIIILEDLFEQKDNFDKIISQIPSQYVVTRFLNIPVKSKKKAQQILPFQLEDGLFSDLQNTHYITKLLPYKNHINAHAFIARTDLFSTFFQKRKNLSILPHLLISEQTLIQDYVENEKIGQNFAIVDLGHTTTKAYIVNNNEVVSNHLIYFGGQRLTTLIAETYQISGEEAEIYKKENAFFLTDNQYKEVDEDQKEFALFMKRAFQEFIKNFQIWDLGYQSITGKQLNKIYLTGGTSKIKNVTNFLSQVLNIKCEYLPPCKFLSSPNSLHEKEDAQLQNVTMMSSLLLKKQTPLNFLNGNFAGNSDAQLPLFTVGFIGSRVLYISLIVLSALLVDHFVTKHNISKEIKIATKKLQAPALELKRTERQLLVRKPERLLRILKKKEKQIQKIHDLIYSQTQTDLFFPLKNISNIIKDSGEFVITKFSSKDNHYTMTLAQHTGGNLKDLQKILKAKLGTNATVKLLKKTLTISK